MQFVVESEAVGPVPVRPTSGEWIIVFFGAANTHRYEEEEATRGSLYGEIERGGESEAKRVKNVDYSIN